MAAVGAPKIAPKVAVVCHDERNAVNYILNNNKTLKKNLEHIVRQHTVSFAVVVAVITFDYLFIFSLFIDFLSGYLRFGCFIAF